MCIIAVVGSGREWSWNAPCGTCPSSTLICLKCSLQLSGAALYCSPHTYVFGSSLASGSMIVVIAAAVDSAGCQFRLFLNPKSDMRDCSSAFLIKAEVASSRGIRGPKKVVRNTEELAQARHKASWRSRQRSLKPLTRPERDRSGFPFILHSLSRTLAKSDSPTWAQPLTTSYWCSSSVSEIFSLQ